MAPKKQRNAAKPKPWLTVLNAAKEQGVKPTLSANKHVRFLKVPGVGRADIERNTQQASAGKESARISGTKFAAKTVPQIDYENVREKIARDGMTRYVLDARGRPRVTEKFDPVTLQAKVTKIGQKYRAGATSRLSVKIPVIVWIVETGRTFEEYLPWNRLSDQPDEVTALRNTPNVQEHLANIIKPPRDGVSGRGNNLAQPPAGLRVFSRGF